MTVNGRIWISWYYQRRSGELARAFSADYHYFSDIFTNRYKRYFLCIPRTVRLIASAKPRVLFVQNPSLVLAVLAALLKSVFRYRLVNDLHTPYLTVNRVAGFVFWRLQDFCVRRSDITLVTNEWIKRRLGGRSTIRILPDPLPAMSRTERADLQGKHNVLYVSSFAEDEPYREVIRAASLVGADVCLYVTGRYEKAGLKPEEMPPNVRLTGYLSDAEYLGLLNSADIVMVLTNQEGCLVCGGYEGVAAGKPLVLSGTEALRKYFSRGVVHVENNAESIAAGIVKAVSGIGELRAQSEALRVALDRDWREKFDTVQRLL